jgi:hypothetical protein
VRDCTRAIAGEYNGGSRREGGSLAVSYTITAAIMPLRCHTATVPVEIRVKVQNIGSILASSLLIDSYQSGDTV